MMWWLCLLLSGAQASTYDIYRAFETKGSFCTVIGGACAADPDFGGGFFQNPAVLTTGGDNFDFDFDFALGDAGQVEPGARAGSENRRQSSSMFAIAGAWGRWGAGLSFWRQEDSAQSTALFGPQPVGNEGRFSQTHWALPLSYRVNADLQLGLSLSLLQVRARTHADPALNLEFTPAAGHGYAWGATLGALYRWRPGLFLGSWWRAPQTITADETATGQLGTTAIALTRSRRFVSPWLATWGAAWTPEGSAHTFLVQVDYVASTPGGQLYAENDFSLVSKNQEAVAKGQNATLAPHAGYRRTLNPKWTAFAGTYLETARVATADDRLHLSAGVSYKIPLGWTIWEAAELMAGADYARDYTQLILTFR